MAKAALTKRPEVLYQASLEHISALDELRRNGQWVLAIYVAGLAVECILQAIALHTGSPDDVKHDLRKWLARCPDRFQAAIQGQIPEQWSFLSLVWVNRLRYLSHEGLLGHLRALQLNRGIKGPGESILKSNADRVIAAARDIHGKGAVTWRQTYSKK